MSFARRHPEVQTRLQADVDDFAENTLELRHFPYLNAVWQETLRLYPTIPAAPRVCVQDITLETEVGNVTIKKGQRVMVSIRHIHRNNQHWSDADSFMPERFLQDIPRHKLAFMPFGQGSVFVWAETSRSFRGG